MQIISSLLKTKIQIIVTTDWIPENRTSGCIAYCNLNNFSDWLSQFENENNREEQFQPLEQDEIHVHKSVRTVQTLIFLCGLPCWRGALSW